MHFQLRDRHGLHNLTSGSCPNVVTEVWYYTDWCIWRRIGEGFCHFDPLSQVTRTSFTIPIPSQERNIVAKFQLDRHGGLAGKVEIGDRRMVHDDNTLSEIPIPDKLKIRPLSHHYESSLWTPTDTYRHLRMCIGIQITQIIETISN